MENRSRVWTMCLLSVFATLVGISRHAHAHTVNLAYRCEDDGSVTFFAATDHLGLEENSGEILVSRNSEGKRYRFDGWVTDLPADVNAQWGWQDDFNDSNVEWQTVNVPHLPPGTYVVSIPALNTADAAYLLDFWIVDIDCGSAVFRADIDIRSEWDQKLPHLKGKDQYKKSKHKHKYKPASKAKKSRGKGKGHNHGKHHGYDKHHGPRGKADRGCGVLVVTIFSGPAFDATQVDEETVELGDRGLDGVVHPLHALVADVDGDGFDDLVLYFSRREMIGEGAIDEQTVDLQLSGFAYDGLLIVAEDDLPDSLRLTSADVYGRF